MALTLATAQAFVTKLSADVAAEVERQAVVLPCITRTVQDAVVASGAALTIDHLTRAGAAITANAADLTAVSATLPIQRLLDNPEFYADTMRALAQRQLNVLEDAALNIANSFTTSGPFGTAATPLVEAIVKSAIQAVLDQKPPSSEPLYLALTPAEAQAASEFTGFGDQQAIGSAAAASYFNGVPAKYYGARLVRTASIRKSGAPTTAFNLVFCQSAIVQTLCQLALTNDASNLQALSRSNKTLFRVALAFDGSDSQLVTLQARGASAVARQEYACQARS